MGARLRSWIVALLAVALGFVAGTAVASPLPAEAPFRVADRVTDRAGVLGADATAVQAAITRLSEATPVDLFVVYVDSFDQVSATDWVGRTAQASGLGVNDVLLAVAVSDRTYDVSLDTGGVISESQLATILATRVEPALRTSDWSGAGVAMADGLREAYEGGSTASPNGSLGWVLGGGVLLLGGAGAALLVARNRRRTRSDAGVPLPDLERRAGAALVQIDDAIRSSEEDMGFAQAQFPLSMTDSFVQALATAKQQATGAFELRKRLDDTVPETDAERRGMLLEILRLADSVNASLGAQKKHFDDLRATEASAGAVLDEMATRADEVSARVDGARSVLASLARLHPAEALASLAGNPDRALELLTSARAAIDAGRERLDAADREAAVAHARIAGQAIGQADGLLTAVAGASATLAEAGSRLVRRIDSLTGDLEDADRLGATDPSFALARREAEAALQVGQVVHERGGDLLGAVTRLEKAEEAVDRALEPYRQREVVLQRDAARASERLGQVEGRLAAVDALVASNRGALDDTPRVRVSEARRLLEQARSEIRQRPQVALQLLDQADRLGAEAQAIAQQQRDSFLTPGASQGRSDGGIDLGSLVLGGILAGMLDGDRGHHGSSGRGPWGGSRGGGLGRAPGGGRRGGFGGRF